MTEINAENVQFLGGGQQGNNQQNSGGNFSRSSGSDFADYDQGDEDFGKSIGESGFGNFSSGGFGNSLAQDSNVTSESDIPF